MSSWCVKVPVREGESVRKRLSDEGLLDRERRIGKEGAFLLIPVITPPGDHEVVERELGPLEQRETDYRKLLRLEGDASSLLPTSFDVIGDVAIVRLADELLPFAREIGKAMRQTMPRLRAVALDRGVAGELRVRDLEIIAGDGPLETVHQEFGVRMTVDPSKVYFNPRLASERHRVAGAVSDGEVVIDMFTGIGPFPLVISAHARPAVIYAIDLNPDAISYLERNMVTNRLKRIVPMTGDARVIIEGLPMADRIIMNLPHSAEDFLPDALRRLKEGGTVHLYLISEREGIEERVEAILEAGLMSGHELAPTVRELKTYSPTMSVYSLDLRSVRHRSGASG